ncbi:hypothetical protein FVE85_5567 [Porphyridium purpureum]|uniref:Mediator of RNA polymerase II transcription subunit 9 n=1 Tax=Porphyridium purpureum TaxID=35688 RepID=A0A5J4Z4A2_PORPP|nr:hypothetical protein FVE85_5567 [Porphyridium purpureum]|eukprot:POR6490..scf295_1
MEGKEAAAATERGEDDKVMRNGGNGERAAEEEDEEAPEVTIAMDEINAALNAQGAGSTDGAVDKSAAVEKEDAGMSKGMDAEEDDNLGKRVKIVHPRDDEPEAGGAPKRIRLSDGDVVSGDDRPKLSLAPAIDSSELLDENGFLDELHWVEQLADVLECLEERGEESTVREKSIILRQRIQQTYAFLRALPGAGLSRSEQVARISSLVAEIRRKKLLLSEYAASCAVPED